MLKSCQNVPRTIFMQISAAITGKCMFRHISSLSAESAAINEKSIFCHSSADIEDNCR